MAGEVLMALGSFRFSIATAAFDKLSRTDDYRWPRQDRLGREPAAQFVGPGATDIGLDGTIYPHYRGGLGQIDALRAMAGRGEPLMLTAGTGRVFGRHVIMRVAEDWEAMIAFGAPRRITFKLSLGRYGEDRPGQDGYVAAPARSAIAAGAAALMTTPGLQGLAVAALQASPLSPASVIAAAPQVSAVAQSTGWAVAQVAALAVPLVQGYGLSGPALRGALLQAGQLEAEGLVAPGASGAMLTGVGAALAPLGLDGRQALTIGVTAARMIAAGGTLAPGGLVAGLGGIAELVADDAGELGGRLAGVGIDWPGVRVSSRSLIGRDITGLITATSPLISRGVLAVDDLTENEGARSVLGHVADAARWTTGTRRVYGALL